MFGLLVFLFTVIPAVEIFLLFKIGAQIGGLNTFMVVIVTGVLGAALAKSQGLSILMQIQEKSARGELPGDQIIQGLMVFAGGILLITPGFMTDIVGFSLVLPGTRHLLSSFVKGAVEKGMKNGNFQFQSFGTNGRGGGFYSYTSTHTQSYGEQDMHNPFEEFQTNSQDYVENDDNVIEAEFKRKS